MSTESRQYTASLPVYRGRLAPTPSGYLHLGHACTFSIAAARASVCGGTLILRIEDLDRHRCRPEYTSEILKDLDWWGLHWNEGPDCGGPHAPYAQSERLSRYLEVWQNLASQGTIYPSPHSRKDVERALRAPQGSEESQENLFPPAWRDDPEKYRGQISPGDSNWRFLVPEGRTITFDDLRCGHQQAVSGNDFGDFLVWRKDGFPSYELAVVVDDHDMGVTEVVRGEDLLVSTYRQKLLYEALGWEVPQFYHTPLIMNESGIRLAKRDGAFALKTLREQRFIAEKVINSFLPLLPAYIQEAQSIKP